MTTTVRLKIGTLTGEVSLGALSDATIGTKIKVWAVATGVALEADTNQQVIDKVAVYLRDLLRREVREWHTANLRTQFEQVSRTTGDAFLDTE